MCVFYRQYVIQYNTEGFVCFQEITEGGVKSAGKVSPGHSNGAKRINRDTGTGKDQSPDQGNTQGMYSHTKNKVILTTDKFCLFSELLSTSQPVEHTDKSTSKLLHCFEFSHSEILTFRGFQENFIIKRKFISI